MLLGWLVPTFAVAPEAVAAPYVADLGGPVALVGWWLVAIPLGVVIGDLVGIWALAPQTQRRLVGPLAAAVFVPLLLFVTNPGFAVAWLLLALSGLAAAYSLGFDALFRHAAPTPLLGRALAINSAGLMSLQGLGFAAAGALAEIVPPQYCDHDRRHRRARRRGSAPSASTRPCWLRGEPETPGGGCSLPRS